MSNQITQEKIPVGFTLRYQIKKQTGLITNMAWSPDGQMLAIVFADETIDICDIQTGKRIGKLEGRHSGSVQSIAWSPDGKILASGSSDTTIGIWNIKTGKFSRRLKGHSNWVWDLKWSPDGQTLASRSSDLTIKLWNTKTGKLKQTLSVPSLSIVWSPDGKILASAHCDTLLFWNSETGEVFQKLEGEFGLVSSIALCPDSQTLALVSDATVLLWDFKTGQPAARLEVHTSNITCISFSSDGHLLASKSEDGSIRLWRCDVWEQVAVFHEATGSVGSLDIAFHPTASILATLNKSQRMIRVWNLDINILLNAALGFESVRYRNAKVVLVGDTGVGKSGLGTVLAGEEFKPTASTHGRHVWSLGVTSNKSKEGFEETREILLWDLAGQVEFRLIHQLSLDQTSIALILFDGSSPTDPFKGVAFWNKALRQAKGSEHLVKYLVAARTDVSTLTVTDERMNAFATELGFQGAFRTSALTGEGIKELLQQVENAIDWEKLPITVSERLFKQMKDFIVNQKQNGNVLKTATDIMQQFRIMYSEVSFNDDEFRAAIKGVESHDLVKTLSFGDYVLLQSELLDNYASAMAVAAREQPDGLGFLEEQAAREGKFKFGSLERAQEEEERIILQSVVELFITKELALLDEGKLVFPSQFNRELPEYPNVQGSTVSYQFEGALLNAYATLVVRLYHSDTFKLDIIMEECRNISA
jgi:small GTP-binding protein